MLKERATKDGEERLQIEDDLNNFIEENRELFQTPVAAFVTFTTQEARERCLKYFYKYT